MKQKAFILLLVLTLFVVQSVLNNAEKQLPSLDQGGIQTKGHILFFFPLIAKSSKITFMPVAEKLAERGHQVINFLVFPNLLKVADHLTIKLL